MDLKVINCAPIDDRQYRIQVETYPEGVNFDEAYVSFSGFFGPHGPHVFAAAPELLEALEWAVDNPHDDAYWISQARAAIAKAKGETK